MARPSKTQQFAIYQDAQIPPTPPHSSHRPSFDDSPKTYDDDDFEDEEHTIGDGDPSIETSNIQPTDTEIDYDRRESAISSLPESSTETDGEYSLPMHKPYTPPMIRPSFRKPNPIRSIYEHSPKRAVYHSRSRTGTPRSVRTSVKGSPLARRKKQEDFGTEELQEYPLVLLHVTLLPIDLRWTIRSMEEILPHGTLENLHLLRSKISETILQRGILIPHPREEYELLEERLLEALELKKERLTKCGHFRARDSTSSTEGSVASGDSGMGSSVEDVCVTCNSPMKAAGTSIGPGKNKWSTKVFAANGLMRASAWAAAWSEMERVDVEILPWISEDLRKQLDATLPREDADRRRQESEAPIHRSDEPQAQIALRPDGEASFYVPHDGDFHDSRVGTDSITSHWHQQSFLTPVGKSYGDTPIPDLPSVYARRDIPLSLLLRNYAFLLMQDKKNIAILGLAILAICMSLRSTLPAGAGLEAVPFAYEITEPALPLVGTGEQVDLLDHHPVATAGLQKSVDASDISESNLNVSASHAAEEIELDQIVKVGSGHDTAKDMSDSIASLTLSEVPAPDTPPTDNLAESPQPFNGEDIVVHLCENPTSRYVLFV